MNMHCKGKKQKDKPHEPITHVDYAGWHSASGKLHPPKRNSCYIVWNDQLQASSMSMQRKPNTCFYQLGDISTLKDGPLKLVDKFPSLGSSVSSTETDINTRLAKAWASFDRLSVIWTSDLTDKIKRSFFPNCSRVDTAIGMYHIEAN